MSTGRRPSFIDCREPREVGVWVILAFCSGIAHENLPCNLEWDIGNDVVTRQQMEGAVRQIRGVPEFSSREIRR